MGSKLYVGNLTYSLTEDQMREVFAKHGEVKDVVIIKDKMTQRSKGFGFVEMSSDQEASNAIDQLNGKNIDGRNIMVNEAREREPRKVANSRW